MNSRRFKLIVSLAVALGSVASSAKAETAPPEGLDLFEKKIRPVLAESCYKCHSESAPKLKGGLKLDSLQGMLTGGDDGPAIVPGKPDQSILIKAIRGGDPDLQMPPKKTLPPAVVADFVRWVQLGAPWPGQTGVVTAVPAVAGDPVANGAKYDRLRRELWSWQPVKETPAPAVKHAAWAKSDIDRFILAKLETANLEPSPAADRVTLLRRATFDLTGLPPTPAEIESFLKDESADAFPHVVDRLLASPRFGERWGRHWLDVARYAESSGMSRNYIYYYAWRFRDYVVNAFNEDKPFDKFITEQLAGDLLPAATSKQRDEQLIATGFLALGPEDYNEKNQQQFIMNRVDEQIDATGKAFLATTIGCARCHDHKFDPIPTADYYSMAGIFKSTRDLPGLDNRQKKLQKYSNAAFIQLGGFTSGELEQEEFDPLALQAMKPAERQAKFIAFRRKMADPRNTAPRHFAMGALDQPVPVNQAILPRGELDKAGAVVPRGMLNITCMGPSPTIPGNESGRLELARWIASPKNPLTSRVIVNRIWEHLFGRGLVRTVDNFGSMGETPSHPELLDHLAGRFVQEGWSVKGTVRQIMLSAAYQQSSAFNKEKFGVDPDNRLVWRMSQRRLEAEAIRDSMLAASGRLNLTAPVGSPALALPPVEIGKRLTAFGAASMSTSDHRSIYLPIFRDALPEVLQVFDMADADVVDGARDVTTVAPQALFVLNNPFVSQQAKGVVDRIVAAKPPTYAARLEMAYKLTLGRSPSAAERERATAYINGATRDAWGRAGDRASAETTAWSSFCQALFACAEFRYVN